MKKVFAIILFVIVGLNAVSIFMRMGQGEAVGSPAYLVVLLVMLVGGFWLYPSKNSQQEVQESQYYGIGIMALNHPPKKGEKGGWFWMLLAFIAFILIKIFS